MRRQVGALAIVFLTAHLFFLPPTLEDVDSINFALGVREFDVARHQPHPPGYPVYVALARASTATADVAGAPAPVPQGLALLSVLAGAILVPLLFAFFRQIDPNLAWWATIVTVCSSLFWFTALRPMSDMAGLAFTVAAQWLLLSGLWGASLTRGSLQVSDVREPGSTLASDGAASPPRFRRSAAFSPAVRLAAGAAVAAVAAGVRSQTVMLTAPLLLAALLWPGTGLRMRQRVAAVAAATLGGFAWGVPLLVASGGLSEYLAALGTQAGEDFGGVTMLWTTRQPRVALDALLNSFVWPWGAFLPGVAVAMMVLMGLLRAAVRAPRMLLVLAIAFGPYAVFHLLFHETHTLRYALPLIAPMALLALYAVEGLGRAAPGVAATVVALISLGVTVPATDAYARDGSPAFRVFEAAGSAGAPAWTNDAPPLVIGMHAVMRRVEEWAAWQQPAPHTRALRAPHGREWLALIDHWRAEPLAAVHFLADPRRTDLALFDPQARWLTASERWTFPEFPFLAGVRPGGTDLYMMTPPGWMLGRGWALTAEVGGVTAASGLGPHIEPSVAWIRARAGRTTLILGGRNLGAETVHVTAALASGVIDSWEAGPGGFFRQVEMREGALAGTGYLPLEVSATAPHQPDRAVPVALEQFDLQDDGMAMLGFLDGWHEPEYQHALARSWRWMSERAHVWVRPVGRDVTLTLTGESPLRYFDRAPVVRVVAGGVELARFEPGGDFVEQIRIPDGALSASGGLLVVESDLWFTPAERQGSPDQRHLAIRMYGVAVR